MNLAFQLQSRPLLNPKIIAVFANLRKQDAINLVYTKFMEKSKELEFSLESLHSF